MDTQQIDINRITINDRVQQRVHLNENVIAEYNELIQAEVQFPPLTVFGDGENLILADGMHRYEAYKLAGQNVVNAEIINGSERDAILHAVGANADHGLRRTNDDKRHAVETLLKDEVWGQWSDGEIARRARVSQPFVSTVRRKLTQNGFEFESRRICANGRSMETSNIGQREPDNSEIEQPEETEASETETSEPSSGIQDIETSNAAENEPVVNAESDGSDSESQDDSNGLEDENGIVSHTEVSDDVVDEVSSDEDEGSSRKGLREITEEDQGESSLSDAQPSEPDKSPEPEPLSAAQTDDIDDLRQQIVNLEHTIREQDRELYLKDQRIAELEEEIDDLKKSIDYYEGEIMAS